MSGTLSISDLGGMYGYQTHVRPTASATALPGQSTGVAAPSAAGASGGPTFSATLGSPIANGGLAAVAGKVTGSGGDSTMAQTQQMMQESHQFNLQFLGIQEQVQQENRSFSTLSNVLKARHETMRSSISNIK